MTLYAFDDADTDMIQLDFWENELITELRDLLSQQPTEEIRTRVYQLVNQLFVLLPVQFDAKTCDDEYLQDVLDEFPTWHTHVNALRVEQALLYEDLRDIRDQLHAGQNAEATLNALFPIIVEWMERLRKHEVEEQRLSQLAINLDLGGPGA